MRSAKRPRGYFYVLWGDEAGPPGMIHVKSEEKGFDSLRLYDGERIDDWPEGMVVYVRYHHEEDYVVGPPDWEVVSERVRRVFLDCRVPDVQFLPLRLVNQESGREIGQYWVLNVLRWEEALDWEHTRWTPDREQEPERDHPILDILKPAFVWEALQGVDIFRLSVRGKHAPGLFFSERLKRCLEEAGAARGMSFLRRPAY